MIDRNNWQEITVVQPATDEHHVIVNAQPEAIVNEDPKIATIACIINDETIKIRYEAPYTKNDFGVQQQVVNDDNDTFEKNQDAEVVHDTGAKNDMHEHHVANVSNDIEHEQEIL